MFKYFHQIWQAEDLRKKIIFTIFLILVFRLAAHLTVPGVDVAALKNIFAKNQLLGVFSMLTGGSLKNFSIVLMGLSPYINASIILQLMTVIVPSLEELSKEGEQGRQKINQYTRWLTLPLAFLQSYGMIALLNKSTGVQLIPNISQPEVILPIMLTVTAGTFLLVWLGEVITERGIGNGISLIIFVSIISGIPQVFGQTLGLAQFQSEKLIPFSILVIFTILMTIFVIITTEGQRNIPITYAGRRVVGKGEESILPIRVNQAGMIPIIFAVSIILFPAVIAQFLQTAESESIRNFAQFLIKYLNSGNPGIIYLILYFLLVVAFTYFYVSITFNPETVAENIQKRGGFIPGIRPGRQTAEFLEKVSSRLNLWGGSFLAFVAVSPLIIQKLFSSLYFGSVPLIITGSGLIIVVGVVLELTRQINAQLIMHDYEKLY